MGSKDVQIVFNAKDDTSKGFLGVRNNLKTLVNDVGLFKSAIMGISGVALLGPMMLNAAGAAKEWGLAVDDIVDQTGAAGEEASKLLVIAKRTGIGVEESAGIFAKFGKSISTAKDEMTKAAAKGEESDDIFSRMGFSLAELQGDMYSVFQKLTDKMRGMADGADKDRVAMELFGRSGYKMHDMLSISQEEMDKVIKKAQDMGLIISNDTAAAWEQFDRQLQGVKGTASKLAIGIGNELLPSLQSLLTKVEDVTTVWGTLDEAQRGSAARSIELVAEIGGVVAALWSAEKAAMALKGALLLLSRHPVITIGIAFAMASKPISELVEQERAEQEKKRGGKYVIVGNHTEFQPTPYSAWEDGAINLFDDFKYTNRQKLPDDNKTGTTLRSNAAGGGKELDNLREKLANMITDFNAKIIQEVGTAFDGNVAKLAAEITKASRELDEMATKGIDVSEGRASLNKYSKVMTDKYTKEQTQALLTLKNDIAAINAAITDDYVAAAEAQYQAELQNIAKQVEERRKSSGNTTAVLEWEIAKTKEAEQKKLQAVIDGEAKKHEQRLYHLEYQRNVMGMTSQIFTAEYQKELQAYIDTNTAKLANANLTADERYRIEQNVSSAVEKLHKLEGQNVNTAWKEAMRRMETDSFDYAGNFVSMFDEMGSTASTALYETISGTGDGIKNLIGDLCNSVLKMWSNMITQMYLMAPMKNLLSGMLGIRSVDFGGSAYYGDVVSVPAYAAGGLQQGPGTSTSDSILSWLSNGEYVINAAAVQKYGLGLFESLNQMRMPRFASGGAVGGGGSQAGVMQPKVELNIINKTGSPVKATQQSSFDSEAKLWIISVWLDAVQHNTLGIRDTLMSR